MVKQSGGVYYAEVELAVSFQPGDNFRVVALPELDQNDTGTSVPQAIFDKLDALNFANEAAPEAALEPTDMQTTPVLTVWRKLHIEIDGMLDDASLGDRYDTYNGQQGNLGVIEPPALSPQFNDRWSITVGTDTGISANAPEGGWIAIRTGQNVVYYEIIGNGVSLIGNGFETTVQFISAANPWNANSTVDGVYEDDFKVVDNNGVQTLERRVSLAETRNRNSELREALIKYAQEESASVNTNRLAAAFIQPVYILAGGPDLEAQNHLDDDTIAAGFTHQTKNSALYWVSYVALAYQRGTTNAGPFGFADFDADRWINGNDEWQPDFIGHYEARSGMAMTPGHTVDGEQNYRNWSAIYLEQLVDAVVANHAANDSLIKDDWMEQAARVFIQQIGRQLQLSPPQKQNPNPVFGAPATIDDEDKVDGIMTVNIQNLPAAQFLFTDEQLLRTRRMTQPDQHTPELP